MLVDSGLQVSPQANCQKYEIEAEVTVQINLLTDNTLAEDARQKILKLMVKVLYLKNTILGLPY